jgi:hypothetical protein
MTPPRSESGSEVSRRFRLLAFASLLLAVLLVRLPFRTACGLVRVSRRRWCRRVLPAERADTVVAAVRNAARWYPGRAACMELSLAAVLMAALSRQRLDWCLGAIADPYRFHAWVEIEGRPVSAAGDSEGLGYMRVLTV